MGPKVSHFCGVVSKATGLNIDVPKVGPVSPAAGLAAAPGRACQSAANPGAPPHPHSHPSPQSFYPQLVLLAGVTEVLGSILVLLGVEAGATLLILFLIPTSVIMHNFWDMPPASQQFQAELIHFQKNLAILGGLLLVGGGAAARAQRKQKVN
jgi:uncharacterized membrane protein YphA (DoxX/SURF4 family)